jgi:hypothetical protein
MRGTLHDSVIRSLARLGLAGLAAWPGIGSAQTLVTGRVTGSGRPLANAEIRIDPRALQSVTGDSGTYRVLFPDAGMVRVSVRAVGFYPATRRFVLAGNDTVVADFALAAVPQTLDPIKVEGHAALVRGKMQGFEERRRAGFGRFFTREFLAERETSTLSNVLRLTNNLQLIRRPDQCGGGFAVATGRSGMFRWEAWMACAGARLPTACYSPVFLDGALFWGPGLPGVPPPDMDQLKVLDLEGIEVYRGGSEVPLQYQIPGSDCGVVLLWTRVGGR